MLQVLPVLNLMNRDRNRKGAAYSSFRLQSSRRAKISEKEAKLDKWNDDA
jgi:hypothetical protein